MRSTVFDQRWPRSGRIRLPTAPPRRRVAENRYRYHDTPRTFRRLFTRLAAASSSCTVVVSSFLYLWYSVPRRPSSASCRTSWSAPAVFELPNNSWIAARSFLRCRRLDRRAKWKPPQQVTLHARARIAAAADRRNPQSLSFPLPVPVRWQWTAAIRDGGVDSGHQPFARRIQHGRLRRYTVAANRRRWIAGNLSTVLLFPSYFCRHMIFFYSLLVYKWKSTVLIIGGCIYKGIIWYTGRVLQSIKNGTGFIWDY